MTSERNTRGQALAALASGSLFGAGLAVSGMTQPAKVIAFLDVAGAWDASLALVMLGAICVHFVAYRIVRGASSPLLAEKFSIPSRRDVDLKLLVGAAVFGVGWGVGGYCPGPGLVSLPSLGTGALLFSAGLLAGLYGTAKVERAIALRDRSDARPNDVEVKTARN